MILFPLPVRLPGRTTTSMDWMSAGLRTCSWCSASREAQLNSSEPQNRMRRGSDFFAFLSFTSSFSGIVVVAALLLYCRIWRQPLHILDSWVGLRIAGWEMGALLDRSSRASSSRVLSSSWHGLERKGAAATCRSSGRISISQAAMSPNCVPLVEELKVY